MSFIEEYRTKYGLTKPSELGCVMLQVNLENKPDLSGIEMYTPYDENKFWLDGEVKEHHVTLCYGLELEHYRVKYPSCRACAQAVWEDDIKSALQDADVLDKLEGLVLENCEPVFFKANPFVVSQGESPDYETVVLTCPNPPEVIVDAHNALIARIPNVQTFPNYNVTCFYCLCG